MLRPIPGPWRTPPAVTPRYVTNPEEVTWCAPCDCGSGLDGTWIRHRDALRPTCTCTCAYGELGPGVVIPMPKEAS